MPARPDGKSDVTRATRGFTMIELMVVVLIISILVALTVTMIPKVYRAVRGTQTTAQLQALAAAINVYYSDFRAYPGPIPNSQLGALYYNYTTTPQTYGVYMPDPSTPGTYKTIEVATGPLTSETYTAMTGTQAQQVTGSENLVLGLLGGLEVKYTTDPSTGAVTLNHFAYSDASVFPDGTIPQPLGPLTLASTGQKRMGAYLQVKVGDLSNTRSMGAPAGFTDEGGRSAVDSPIPEFLDKYSNPMPILYLRANVGAGGVVSYGGKDENSKPVSYQYDLAQVLGYTGSLIGTLSNTTATSHHGLQDIMPSASATMPMADTVGGDFSATGPNEAAPPHVLPPGASTLAGANAFAYLRDPNTPAKQPAGTDTLHGNAHPRQKDGYILISAGPDGVYGTADDKIYPGDAVIPQ